MLKNYKWKLLISSVLILIPMLLGLVFWNQLPAQFPTHFGVDGNPDAWGGKLFVVLFPLILLVLHWLCVLITVKDPKNKDQTKKAIGMTLWIMPMLSFVVSAIMYAVAFDIDLNVSIVLHLFLGVLFIVIGNYLPKCKQNHTLGIKLIWTLSSEENWNATHRFGGKVWVVCGFLTLAASLLPMGISLIIAFATILMAVLLPSLYSWRYYKKQAAEGTVPEKAAYPTAKWSKTYRTVGLAVTVLLLVFLVIILFTGDIQVEFGDESFTVNATYWEELTVPYDAIEEVRLSENFTPGIKVNGFNSARLNLGVFENEAFGRYTVYTYTGCKQAIILNDGRNVLVINGVDEAATRAMYDILANK